jgi:hypothetical protein
MIKSKKFQLVMVLVLACLCAPILSAEPNEAETKLKFEINKEKPQLWLNNSGRRAVGPIKPTHVAVFYIRPSNLPEGHEDILQILNTSAGKTLSENQRHFLTASDSVICLSFQDIRNHDQIRLYAVSEEEAKKTARAYLECAINRANAKVQEYEKYLNETKEKIIQIKKSLPEKQKQSKAAESKFKETKNARYFSLEDGEAYENAKETMLQMDKMLDVLEIELEGIQEKLTSIEKFRSTKRLGGRRLSEETLDKLDHMLVEQMIELKGAEARKEATLRIRGREKGFLDLFNQWDSLNSEVNRLKRNLDNSEKNMRNIEKTLANPRKEMLPPKVYQDRITIYPVRVED